MNSIVYHLMIERYSMKTLHWYFPWATALPLYNMTGRGEKLQQLHCYHLFSDSLDIYLTKNHYENYSPKMVPIAKIWGSGSWTIIYFQSLLEVFAQDVTSGGCLSKYRRAFIVYMFRRPPEVWSLVSDNASISGTGKASMAVFFHYRDTKDMLVVRL